MRPEDLDKRTLFALQIDKLMSEKNKTDDPQQIQLMMHRLSQLKEYVQIIERERERNIKENIKYF